MNFNNYEAGEGEDIVRVAISWGNMSFTYHMGEWDPTTHQYIGESYWAAESKNNQVSIHNAGKPIYANLNYTSTKEGISGSFDRKQYALDTNKTGISKLTISGTPEGEEFTNAQLGTITITISEQLNMTGINLKDEVSYIGIDGKIYDCIFCDTRDGNYVLLTKNSQGKIAGSNDQRRAHLAKVGAVPPEIGQKEQWVLESILISSGYNFGVFVCDPKSGVNSLMYHANGFYKNIEEDYMPLTIYYVFKVPVS